MQTSHGGDKKIAPASKKATNTTDHLHQQAFNNSLLPNVITNTGDGKIIKVNMAACNLLGYSEKELLSMFREDIFNISENSFKKMYRQRAKDGHARANITAIKKNGDQLPCEVTSVVFANGNNGSKAITTIVDLRPTVLKQKNIDAKKEKQVSENLLFVQSESEIKEAGFKKWLKYMSMTSYDVMLEWDIISNGIYIGDSYEELFGYKVNSKIIDFNDWLHCIHPEEKESFEKNLQKALVSRKKKWEETFRFIRQDGSVANATSRAVIIRDAGGKAIRMIGAMQDVTWQKALEEKLGQEISTKDAQIADAVADAHELERSDIGKELHDNINQLLVASGLYMGMAKKEGLNRAMYLANAQKCTKNAIEEIRTLTQRLVTDIIKEFGLSEAIARISTETMEVNALKISCSMGNFVESKVKNKFKLNIFRIIQEQMNNIVKHAKASLVTVAFSQNAKKIILSIADNGAGFDTSKKQNGIGIGNIKSRAAFYKGSAGFVSEPGKGCVLTVVFPVTPALLN